MTHSTLLKSIMGTFLDKNSNLFILLQVYTRVLRSTSGIKSSRPAPHTMIHFIQQGTNCLNFPRYLLISLCISPVVFPCVSLELFTTSGSFYIFLPILHKSLSLEGRDLMKTFHLESNAPKSPTFCILSSCGSLCLLLPVSRKSYSNDGWPML